MTTIKPVQPSVVSSSPPMPPPLTTPVHEPAWNIARLFPNQGDWTESDFLKLNTKRLVELSDGSMEVLEMPTMAHQRIVSRLYILLSAYCEAKRVGEVLFAPFHVKMAHGRFRDPDVLFIKTENAHRKYNEYWDGADLVMEVVSDNDRRRDLETKRFEYAQAGIPEYWIVDPMLGEITVLSLAGNRYELAGVFKAGAQAASVLLPGFTVDVAAAFAEK